jgi:small GTP-binding protein
MKRTVIGILAHVDAGKTTLSEAMLYSAGAIRGMGRVDHGDAFLDHFELERRRGITIFSKQAVLEYGGMRAVLLDTPGHADFSAETERVLDVLDCAVLVLSGPEGVQSHTRTLWRLLRRRRIPAFLFINKMDQPGADRAAALRSLEKLEGSFVPMDEFDPEAAAMCDEALLEEFLETGAVSGASLADAVRRCALYPCWFGSALKMQGVESFLKALESYAPAFTGGGETAAKVFKITHDDRGARLTHLKVTGGVLRVRDVIGGEKINQIRVYSGARFTQAEEALPGDVVAVTGLTKPQAGSGLGAEPDSPGAVLEPRAHLHGPAAEGCGPHRAAVQLSQLNEEDPSSASPGTRRPSPSACSSWARSSLRC